MTEDVVNRGVMYIYYRETGSEFVEPISNLHDVQLVERWKPYTSSTGYTLLLEAFASTGPKLEPLQNMEFRYVLVPGGQSSGRSAGINYNNYEEVKEFYDL